MDQKKKIIVGVVGLIAIIALIALGKYFLGSKKPTNLGNKLSILLPKVDKAELESSTKKAKYDKQERDTTALNPFIKTSIDTIGDYENMLKKQQLEAELQRILEMQQQMDAERKAMLNAANAKERNSSRQIAETAHNFSHSLAKTAQNGFPKKNHFYGAGSNNSETILDLIPAETVDKALVINGSTIAVRTKEAFTLKNPPITIPKDAIVYGKVSFSGIDRMEVDIVSYKTNKKLYQLDLSVYDFDGRPGIHLSNRSWTKIPSKVSKDVFDYVYRRGTQPSTFGNQSTSANLKEAKNIGILSATKEIAAEIFDKRRLLMPRKYHLWINIREENIQ